jgi:hypothetical protein
MPSNLSAQLPALGVETTAIIHDNLGIVLTYAFSKQALSTTEAGSAQGDGTFQIAFFLSCRGSGQSGPSSNWP